MRVLLSIKPEFVEKIFSGEKRFEYRKILFRKNVSTVVIYATSPIGKVVGEFEISKVLFDSPPEIWNRTKDFSGISQSFFSEYFRGRDKGYAIEIKHAIRYKASIDLKELGSCITPPQSFRYVE